MPSRPVVLFLGVLIVAGGLASPARGGEGDPARPFGRGPEVGLAWPEPGRAPGLRWPVPARSWLPWEREGSGLTPVVDWDRALPGDGGEAERDDAVDAEGVDPDGAVPRLRLEAHLLVAPFVRSKTKHGKEGLAHAWDTAHDARVPDRPALGQRYIVDLKVHRWISLGVAWSQVVVDGPRRGVHYRGISHQATYFPPDSRVSTTIDVQTGEAWARLVVSDDDRVRFAIGLGAVWASHRVAVHRGDLGASGRVETFFTPTLSYLLAVRVGPLPAWVYVESVTAPFGPWRFPSLFSSTRGGLRFDVAGGLELVLSASFGSGQISDTEDLWGGKARPGKRWRTATWYAPTGEVGLAWTFG